MTTEEKIGQLFCMIATDAEEAALADLLRKVPFGGIMYRPTAADKAVAATRFLQTASKVPVLIAANLEKRRKRHRAGGDRHRLEPPGGRHRRRGDGGQARDRLRPGRSRRRRELGLRAGHRHRLQFP
jgi:hypothetical protein